MITFLLKSCDHKTPCLEDETRDYKRVKIFMSVISLKLDSFKTKFNAAEIFMTSFAEQLSMGGERGFNVKVGFLFSSF